jgi:hypothetical protein
LRRLKNSVFRLKSRISSLKKALNGLIDDDEIMAMMNLTKLRANPDLYRCFSFVGRALVIHLSDIEVFTSPALHITLTNFSGTLYPETSCNHTRISKNS